MEFLAKYQKVWKRVGIIGGVYLGMKYLVPLVIPFLLAALAAYWLRPTFLRLEKWIRIKPAVSACLFLVLFLGGSAAGLFFLGRQLLELANRFLGGGKTVVYAEQALLECCQAAERMLGFPAEQVRQTVTAQVHVILEQTQGGWQQKLLGSSAQAVRQVGKVLAAVVIGAIAFVLWSGDFEKIREECRGSELWRRLVRLVRGILEAVGGYVRAQCIIIGMIMSICTVGFFLAGSSCALLLGILTGLLDALPVLGTGIVMVPWLAVEVIRGEYLTAVILGLTYGGCTLTREILEPRLVGKRLGLFPILVLLSVYVGVKLYGPSGIVLGPLSMLVIQELWKEVGKEG